MLPAQGLGNGLQYFLTDHFGSLLAVTDASGTLTSQQRYLPFGQVRADAGAITQTDFGFTFQRSLPEAGLMDYDARFYLPALGRFSQPDTLVPGAGNPHNLNRYAYVRNNPLRYADPTGHWAFETNKPEKELRRNSYIHAAERVKRKDPLSAHLKEYYIYAAAYYNALASEAPQEVIEIGQSLLESRADNVRRNGWNGIEDAKNAAGDVAIGNMPDMLGSVTTGAAGLIWSFGSNHSTTSWNNKMAQRGWTIEQINEALEFGEAVPAHNNVHPGNRATRYIHPVTGRSVVMDDVTNEILHIGGDDFDY